MKLYKGSITSDPEGNPLEYNVTVDGKPLPLRLDIRNHSPTGFCWGYGGSGPAQLSLALLTDYLGSSYAAMAMYQRFKVVIARLQDGEGRPLKSWELTSADVETALGTILRKSSPTWPTVGRFSFEMERQLSLHRDRGDRPGWMAAAPSELASAIFEQLEKLSTCLLLWDPREDKGGMSEEQRAVILKHCAHLANLAMMVADCIGALPEAMPGERLLTEMEATFKQSMLLNQVEQIRVLLGANQGEELEAALARYTAAVQLGCARKLETHAEELARNLDHPLHRERGTNNGKAMREIAASVVGAAAFIRKSIPEMPETMTDDILTRIVRERLEEFKDGVLRGILPAWWKEAMGELPHAEASRRLSEMLEEYDPIGTAPQRPVIPTSEQLSSSSQGQNFYRRDGHEPPDDDSTRQ